MLGIVWAAFDEQMRGFAQVSPVYGENIRTQFAGCKTVEHDSSQARV
jgi:hypothetical protein